MKQLKILGYFMKLIRWPNLFILVITMFLMRYCIIKPLLTALSYELNLPGVFHLQLSFSDFLVLVFSTGLITAAGYIINDYFDRKTDMINKPYKVIVGRFIKRRIAIALHALFNILGVAGGIYISYKNHLNFLSLVFIITTGILWFYSTNYKKQPFIGNLLVSLLTAFIPLMVLLFELPLLNRAYKDILINNHTSLIIIVMWVFSFVYFAFVLSFLREVVKDAEDLQGDQAYGCVSIPMLIGFKWTKTILTILISVVILSLGFVLYKYIRDLISIIYLSLAVIIPLIYIAAIIIKANHKKDYSKASLLLKLVMFLGVLYAAVVNYIISVNFL